MFYACDEIFPAPAAMLSPTTSVSRAVANRDKLLDRLSKADVILCVRALYRTVARMRCVNKATASAPWLMTEAALYHYMSAQHPYGYKVDYAFSKIEKSVDTSYPDAASLLARLWFHAPESSAVHFRQLNIGNYKQNGEDVRFMREEMGIELAARPIYGGQPSFVLETDYAARLIAKTKEGSGPAVVRLSGDAVEFLDEMDVVDNIQPSPSNGPKLIRHRLTNKMYRPADFLRSLVCVQTDLRHRDKLRRALDRRTQIKHEKQRLRVLLKLCHRARK